MYAFYGLQQTLTMTYFEIQCNQVQKQLWESEVKYGIGRYDFIIKQHPQNG